MKYEFTPKGVCSSKYIIDIDENNNINSLEVIGGCDGNLKGISNIVKGMNIDKVIDSFLNVECRSKGTSCPDQIARALLSIKQSQ